MSWNKKEKMLFKHKLSFHIITLFCENVKKFVSRPRCTLFLFVNFWLTFESPKILFACNIKQNYPQNFNQIKDSQKCRRIFQLTNTKKLIPKNDIIYVYIGKVSQNNDLDNIHISKSPKSIINQILNTEDAFLLKVNQKKRIFSKCFY